MSKTALSAAMMAIIVTALAMSANAQTQSNVRPRAMHAAVQMRVLSADKFVQKAAMSDLFEVESSKLALQRSQNEDVQAFAQRMIDDHTQSTRKLTGLLQSASVGTTPPNNLDRAHQHMLQQLQNESAARFDRLYMRIQVKGHQDALKLQQGYGRHGDNDQLKSFASEAAPMVQDHLTQARRILRGIDRHHGV
jgi:putative membrane protein